MTISLCQTAHSMHQEQTQQPVSITDLDTVCHVSFCNTNTVTCVQPAGRQHTMAIINAFFINNKKIKALTRASNGHTNELQLKRPLTWYVHSTTTTEYATAQALTNTATTTTTSYIGTVN